jgi:hypothetical protein
MVATTVIAQECRSRSWKVAQHANVLRSATLDRLGAALWSSCCANSWFAHASSSSTVARAVRAEAGAVAAKGARVAIIA